MKSSVNIALGLRAAARVANTYLVSSVFRNEDGGGFFFEKRCLLLIVRVFGIPSSIEKGPLISLHRTIRKSVMCVAGGKGIAQDTKVFFPSDRLDQNWGEDLVCYVEGICNPSGKMGVIRSALASRVAKDLMEFAQTSIPYIKSVQVLVTRHEMDDGFCHIHVRGASKPKDSSSLEDRKVAPPEGHLFYSWMGHPQKVEKPD